MRRDIVRSCQAHRRPFPQRGEEQSRRAGNKQCEVSAIPRTRAREREHFVLVIDVCLAVDELAHDADVAMLGGVQQQRVAVL